MDLDFEKYKSDQFCSNKSCNYYGKQGAGNIKTKSSKNQQVYCNGCQTRWVITKDTFFYNLKTPLATILEVLHLLSEGMGVNAVCRAKGVSDETLTSWVLRAAEHVNEVSAYLKRDMQLTQCQIDEFWSFIFKKRASLENLRRIETI